MRKIVFVILLVLPIVAFAQGIGGEIRRPVKTYSQSNAVSSRTNSSSNNNSKPASNRNDRDAILQNLINNMVHVVGGTFTMGATPEQGSDNYSSDKPTHEVFLSSFSIGKKTI